MLAQQSIDGLVLTALAVQVIVVGCQNVFPASK
jgi:small neutral amino acid transporter SnatA (MarC family)